MSNKQIQIYLEERPLKNHQIKTIELFSDLNLKEKSSVLEIGHANGLVLDCLAQSFPQYSFTGIDISSELHEIAKHKLQKYAHVQLLQQDITSYQPETNYDVVIAEGVMSVFQNPEDVLKQWCSWLKERGTLIIFGTFSPYDMDFKFQFKNLQNDQGWEYAYNSLSLKTLESLLERENCKMRLEPFEINFSVEKTIDPVKTYTEKIGSQTKMVMAGTLILNFYHLIITKQAE